MTCTLLKNAAIMVQQMRSTVIAWSFVFDRSTALMIRRNRVRELVRGWRCSRAGGEGPAVGPASCEAHGVRREPTTLTMARDDEDTSNERDDDPRQAGGHPAAAAVGHGGRHSLVIRALRSAKGRSGAQRR